MSNIIKLNVGGKLFMTTKMTLNSKGINFLTKLVDNYESKNIDVVTDEKGYIFIDRNGKYFEIILEYLRTSKWNLPDNVTPSTLQTEIDFYCIPFFGYKNTKNNIYMMNGRKILNNNNENNNNSNNNKELNGSYMNMSNNELTMSGNGSKKKKKDEEVELVPDLENLQSISQAEFHNLLFIYLANNNDDFLYPFTLYNFDCRFLDFSGIDENIYKRETNNNNNSNNNVTNAQKKLIIQLKNCNLSNMNIYNPIVKFRLINCMMQHSVFDGSDYDISLENCIINNTTIKIVYKHSHDLIDIGGLCYKYNEVDMFNFECSRSQLFNVNITIQYHYKFLMMKDCSLVDCSLYIDDGATSLGINNCDIINTSMPNNYIVNKFLNSQQQQAAHCKICKSCYFKDYPPFCYHKHLYNKDRCTCNYNYKKFVKFKKTKKQERCLYTLLQ